MEHLKFEIVLLKHYWKKITKLLPWLEEYVRWKKKLSLVSMWHNYGSNVSSLGKKTLENHHFLVNLNYELLRIYAEFWKKIRKKILVGCQKNLVHQKVPCITRLRHLENHTEAVDLYLMNWHLNRLNGEWISVVSLSIIPWMKDLSELSHVMKNGSITANLMSQNNGLITVNLPKSSLKKSVQPQSNVVCLVEFWRQD